MDLQFSTEHTVFQDEVRTFIKDNLPRDLQEKRQRGLRLETVSYTHLTLPTKA